MTVEARNAIEDVYLERQVTAEETAVLQRLPAERLAGSEFVGSKDLDPPYVEVEIAFDANRHALEIIERYPVGVVPEVWVDLKERFFAGAFR